MKNFVVGLILLVSALIMSCGAKQEIYTIEAEPEPIPFQFQFPSDEKEIVDLLCRNGEYVDMLDGNDDRYLEAYFGMLRPIRTSISIEIVKNESSGLWEIFITQAQDIHKRLYYKQFTETDEVWVLLLKKLPRPTK